MKRLILFFATLTLSAQTYDIVITGGRVMDPESGLDAVRSDLIHVIHRTMSPSHVGLWLRPNHLGGALHVIERDPARARSASA